MKTSNLATLQRADFSFLPDVSFTELDTSKTEAAIILIYEGLAKTTLYPGDPIRLFLSTLAAVISQRNIILDQTGKLNMLRYAVGPHLDHLGVMLGQKRLGAKPAETPERFSIAAPVPYPVLIPEGTRVTADSKVYFAATETSAIPAGESFVDVRVAATVAGAAANGLVAGQINRLVDPLSTVVTVSNLEETSGGAEIEDDDSFRDRIFMAPETFTCAGSGQAYIFFALSAHPNIGDVTAHSPIPGRVNVYLLLKNGDIPAEKSPEVSAAKEILSDKTVRPLTDHLSVLPAVAEPFDYQFTYYMDSRVAGFTEIIDANVQQAAAEYERWQTTKIGRDLNPDELVKLCKLAGAKRIVPEIVISRDGGGIATETIPFLFRPIDHGAVPKLSGDHVRVFFGGVEAS